MSLCHRDGLNSLLALGFHCQALQDYVESATSLLPGQQKSSLIRRAVATGLSGGRLTHDSCPRLVQPEHHDATATILLLPTSPIQSAQEPSQALTARHLREYSPWLSRAMT